MSALLLVLVGAIILIGVVGVIAALVYSRRNKSNCFLYSCPRGEYCSNTGSCIPTGTCASDGDCPYGPCVDGVCLVIPEEPIACKASGDCPLAGQRCIGGVCSSSCEAQEDCRGGSICYRGVCRPKPCLSSVDCHGGEGCLNTLGADGLPGYYCRGGEDCVVGCPEGLLCLGGHCRECNVSDSVLCGQQVCSNETCKPCSEDCPVGTVCSSSGSCCPAEGFGSPCSGPFACPPGNGFCVEGKCTCSPLQTGEVCQKDSDCASGSCREMMGLKKCSTMPCLGNDDCPSEKPYCKGYCDTSVLGSYCQLSGECHDQGFFCVGGTCQVNPPGLGYRCLDVCEEGLECRFEPEVNTLYKYCLPSVT